VIRKVKLAIEAGVRVAFPVRASIRVKGLGWASCRLQIKQLKITRLQIGQLQINRGVSPRSIPYYHIASTELVFVFRLRFPLKHSQPPARGATTPIGYSVGLPQTLSTCDFIHDANSCLAHVAIGGNAILPS